jgi:hypothetical protein
VEKHIRNSYMKSLQALAGVKPALKAWVELNLNGVRLESLTYMT